MHIRRERVNLSPRVNTSKLFEFKKKLNAAPDAGEDNYFGIWTGSIWTCQIPALLF
jgi:hypothetical protein